MGNVYPELYLDMGSYGGNTPSNGPKSLVPGELYNLLIPREA